MPLDHRRFSPFNIIVYKVYYFFLPRLSRICIADFKNHEIPQDYGNTQLIVYPPDVIFYHVAC